MRCDRQRGTPSSPDLSRYHSRSSALHRTSTSASSSSKIPIWNLKKPLCQGALRVGIAPVDPVEKRQNIAIDLPTEVRPNSDLLVKLDLGKGNPGRRVTIAAIDEGILSLTRYKTPDPIKALYSKRRLEVQTYETIGWNLMLPAANAGSQQGGGMDGGGAKRIQPTKPVALWSGILEVPISGKLEHSFKIPTYRGSLKVMVVSAGPQRVGSAAKKVPVRDPLVLLASLPKQLSQGDRFFIPVSLTNMSGKARD